MSYNATGNSASRRIATLLDEGSFVEIGGAVTARSTDFNMQEKADSVRRCYYRIRSDRWKSCLCIQPGC